MPSRYQARRGLAVYFTVVVAVSATLEWWIISHGGLTGSSGWLVLPLMYTPALGSIVARIAGREGIHDISFRWGGWAGTRASLAAWLLPVAVGLAAYGLAWATGLVEFAPPAVSGSRLQSIANPSLRFLLTIPLALTIGMVLSCVYAFGEELGWRGYMVPRLVEAEVHAPDVVSGIIWCTWHVPLILWGGYAVGKHPALSVLLFFASIMPVALLYFRWRMTSGSLWPTVIAHGAWNVVIQSVFDRYSHGDGATLWVGESGLLTAAAMWVAFLLMRRARWAGTAT
jgi:membrane protease YdiL (CAAX protease family)